MNLVLPEGYEPSEKETYMNPMHLEYFRQKLLSWKSELLNNSQETINHLKEENWQESSVTDQASIELDAALELRTRDRYRKLLSKINQALERICTDEYGYCEETGEEIGLKRLKARPIATLSIEAQQKHESYERQHNDDE